jgi:hypothetical protein
MLPGLLFQQLADLGDVLGLGGDLGADDLPIDISFTKG